MRAETAGEAPIERIRRHLVGLRMPRALETLDHLVQQIERGQIGSIEAIEMLLAEELTIRESRRIKAALQMARLSVVKTLSGFDFSFQPSLDRNRILALAQLDFIDRHDVVHFIGQSGTGKSHLAVALGVEAVRAGRSVYFAPLADIIDSLTRAEREGRLRERIRFLCRTQLLIIDEIGYLSVGAGAGNLFFQLVNARYEREAMILTAALPNGARCLVTPWWPPPCWTGCCITLSSCRSKAPAIGCASTPICWCSRCTPARPAARSHRRVAVAAHPR
jgi:DNA replication protein DnaC